MTIMLVGIFIGAVVFAATLNAAWRAYSAEGGLRWTQGIAAASTILAIGAVSLGLPVGVARAFGLVLTLVSMANVIQERGWNRAFPVIHFAIGMTIADGEIFEG
ncbi:hypothetical protein ACQ5SO_05950 [Rhodovulum sp. DZ06]|uniref:hypothetical protein n=1 Tax=Rhodovulum sp. DZ06 TaxID=3425126 RepID=UPI003D3574D7